MLGHLRQFNHGGPKLLQILFLGQALVNRIGRVGNFSEAGGGGTSLELLGGLGQAEEIPFTWIRDGFWDRRVEIACISCANNVSMAAMLANPMG